MSVYLRMLGSPLPCNLLELLHIHPLPPAACVHESLLREAARAYPDVLYKLGMSHLGRQELGLAKMRFAEAVAAKGDFVKARLALAAVCDLLARHDEAVTHIDAALAAGDASAEPSRYTMLCAAGFCLERTGNWQVAVNRYTEALSNHPSDLFADYRLAAIYLSHNMLEEAVRHHRAILEQQPQEQAVRVSLAHLLQILERHQEAVWEYEKAFCLEPESWELQSELAEELTRMGNTSEAIEHLRQLVDRQPQFPDLRLRLANLYSDRGDDDSAMDCYAGALAIHAEYLDCHIAMARHELKMGRTHNALEHFQRAIAINDQKVEGYVGLAVALHRLGETQRAKETLESVARISGNTDVLLAQLGMVELKGLGCELRGTEQKSDSVSLDSIAEAPPAGEDGLPVATQWLADQAKRYEQLLTEHPTWADVRVRYGMLLKLLGRTKQSIGQLRRVTAENPGCAEAWVQLGLARQDEADSGGAMEAFERAVELRPDWAALHYQLGLIYCSQMEFDLAMEQLEMAEEMGKGINDLQRQIWVAVEGMQMKGMPRGSESGQRDASVVEEML